MQLPLAPPVPQSELKKRSSGKATDRQERRKHTFDLAFRIRKDAAAMNAIFEEGVQFLLASISGKGIPETNQPARSHPAEAVPRMRRSYL